ncbi:MAG: alpha-mannosidase [Verrucomicrobiales bacterium]|jgi:alpha-mannosidase|nr:alpha-mannosidase [Verrucomicrobiales bacterium]
MHKHPRLTEGRIANLLPQIQAIIYHGQRPLELGIYEVRGEPVPAAAALRQGYRPFAAGDEWGATWDTAWFRARGQVPAEWRGREVVALVDLGFAGGEGFTAEALVWQDGQPTRALNVNRRDVPVAASAKGGERVEFFLEAGANRGSQLINDNELLLADYHGKPRFRFVSAELALFDRAAWQLYLDVKITFELLQALPADEPRYGQLLRALNEAANRFDPADRGTVAAARAALKAVLARKNGGSAHRVSAIGHAHIDTAWLWPLRETIRKCARTFSTALRYMEEYPDYVFACSSAQQYAWMKEYYPRIYADMRAAAKRGQWEPIGSMWIEADCNLTSGESLVRQILHGKKFFQEEFECEPRDVWLPDVFGYCASMPQIMRQSGVKWFLTQKISWNQFNKFPHHTFWWEGIDGTRVFTHFPPADTYNARMTAAELRHGVKNFGEHDRARRSLFVYGHGDGGGGPTREMIEVARRAKDLDGLPKVALERVASFFPQALRDAQDLPVWIGELYFELHRGTYTTQARNKRGNRQGEFALREAEWFDALAVTLGGATVSGRRRAVPHAVYDVVARENNPSRQRRLERAWKLLLLNQFHDIIPGSSINWVYQDSASDYVTISELCRQVLDETKPALALKIDTADCVKPLLVTNTLSHARNEVITLPDGTARRVHAPALGYAVVDADADAAAFGYAVTAADADAAADSDHPVATVSVRQLAGQIVVDNGLLQVTFDKHGLIASLRDLAADREVIAPGERGNLFQLFKDYPNNFDAWDLDLHYQEVGEDLVAADSVTVSERGPLRVTVSVARQFGQSAIRQDIIIRAGSRRVDFVTKVDWQESHKLLKVAFPVSIRSPRATYEIQYGHLERPTHYNTSWDLARFEVCAQKWADLSERDYGVALLNDCKYGHDIFGHTLRLSLLRAPSAPDPLADRGEHEFTYALLPHAGDIVSGRVVEEAYNLNVPLTVSALPKQKGALPASRSFFSIDRPGIVIEAVKNAEDGSGIIVRLYEAHGTRGPLTLTTTLPFTKAVTTDLLERTTGKVPFHDGQLTLTVRPFEIVTLKFTK